MAVADIKNLTVRYGRFTALEDFSVVLPEGSTGLLGPNGAGKTTFIKALLGFVEPAAGGGKALDFDIVHQGRELRQLVGYMPEQDCHIPGMSAVQFVAYAGELAGLPPTQAMRRSHEVLEYCGLGEARYRKVETYSTGMKQRIKLAQALVHGPKLLLLDEPTNGLDHRGREEMLKLVRDISADRSVNVIVSTHLLRDVERTCDRVVLLMQGHLRAEGTLDELKKVKGTPMDIELEDPSPEFVAAAASLGFESQQTGRARYRLQAGLGPVESAEKLFEASAATEVRIREIGVAQRSLEEVFLEAVSE